MHNASTIVAPKLGVSWYSARLMRLAGLLGEGRVESVSSCLCVGLGL